MEYTHFKNYWIYFIIFQGSPQWITVGFRQDQEISSVHIQFQGGFVGKDCILEIHTSDNSALTVPFYPEDINTLQVFSFEPVKAKKVKVVFKNSTDFFGRIVIYSLMFS